MYHMYHVCHLSSLSPSFSREHDDELRGARRRERASVCVRAGVFYEYNTYTDACGQKACHTHTRTLSQADSDDYEHMLAAMLAEYDEHDHELPLFHARDGDRHGGGGGDICCWIWIWS